MNKKTVDTLLTIVCMVLAFGGIIFFLISILGDSKDTRTVCLELIAVCLANVLNLIRWQRKRREKQNSEDEKVKKTVKALPLPFLNSFILK